MLVDWVWVQRRRTPAEAFFEHPRTLPQWISPLAGIAFAVGLAFSIWFGDIAPAWFNNQVPIPFVGGLLSAAVLRRASRLATGQNGPTTPEAGQREIGKMSGSSSPPDRSAPTPHR